MRVRHIAILLIVAALVLGGCGEGSGNSPDAAANGEAAADAVTGDAAANDDKIVAEAGAGEDNNEQANVKDAKTLAVADTKAGNGVSESELSALSDGELSEREPSGDKDPMASLAVKKTCSEWLRLQ